MLYKAIQNYVIQVVETQYKQYQVWQQWEACDITWEVTIAKLSILHNEINDTPIEWFVSWITSNKTNFSSGSNGMKTAFSDPDNIWNIFIEFEGHDVESDLYDYISDTVKEIFI